MKLYLGQLKAEMKNMKLSSAFPWDIDSTFQSGFMQVIKIKPYLWLFKKAHMHYNFLISEFRAVMIFLSRGRNSKLLKRHISLSLVLFTKKTWMKADHTPVFLITRLFLWTADERISFLTIPLIISFCPFFPQNYTTMLC